MNGIGGALGRMQAKIRDDGLGSVAKLAGQRVRDEVSLDETHVWYELRLDRDFPVREMPENTELVRATEAQADMLAELDTVSPETARERIRAGHDLWLSLLGGELAFACWTFNGSAPVLAAPGGWMELPPEIICLEDSIASTTVRGRGIAPATWAQIALQARGSGIESMVTKIRDFNVPPRKAVVKVGFEEIVTSRYRRKGLMRYASVRTGEGRAAEWISDQLML